MKRLMSLLCVLGFIAALALSHSALADDPAAAEAGAPFHGSLGGNETQQFVFPPEPGPPTGFHILGRGTGHATHLERFTVNWTFDAVIDASGNASAKGHCHFMAADGDSLLTVATAEGTPPDENGIISVVETHTITPTGGTGRFAGASGNFIQKRLVQVSTDGAINYTFGSFEGSIILGSN